MIRMYLLLCLLLWYNGVCAQNIPLTLSVDSVYPSPYYAQHAGVKVMLGNNSADTIFISKENFSALLYSSFGLVPEQGYATIVLTMDKQLFDSYQPTLALRGVDSFLASARFDSLMLSKNKDIKTYAINKKHYFRMLPHSRLQLYMILGLEDQLYWLQSMDIKKEIKQMQLSLNIEYLVNSHKYVNRMTVTSKPSLALKEPIDREFDYGE